MRLSVALSSKSLMSLVVRLLVRVGVIWKCQILSPGVSRALFTQPSNALDHEKMEMSAERDEYEEAYK